MSPTRFRVNPHSTVAWMLRNSLLETGAISEVYVTAMGLKPTTIESLSQIGWVFVYKPSGYGFESSCSHLFIVITGHL